MANFALSPLGRAVLAEVYEAIEARPFSLAALLDDLLGIDPQSVVAEMLARTQAIFIREGVARLVQEVGAMGRILPNFDVSDEGNAGAARLAVRGFAITPGMTVTGATERMLEITGERGAQQNASDYAEYVENSRVIPGNAQLWFVPEAVVGGAGARKKEITQSADGCLVMETGRDVVAGFCLAYAVIAMTGYKIPQHENKRGDVRTPSVKTWVTCVLGLELIQGEHGRGLPLEAVGAFEEATGFSLHVICLGSSTVIRDGAEGLAIPPNGVAIGYDPARGHYGVVRFLSPGITLRGSQEFNDEHSLREDVRERKTQPVKEAKRAARQAEKAERRAEKAGEAVDRADEALYSLVVGDPQQAAQISRKPTQETQPKPPPKPRATVYYDLETVSDPGGACLAYAAAAIIVFDEDDITSIPATMLEWKASRRAERAFYKTCGKPTRERSALSLLCAWIRFNKSLEGRNVTISAYNGSRFDHILMLDDALRSGGVAARKGALHMKGTAVLALAAFGAKTHDPANFSGGKSLKDVCGDEGYQLVRRKVDGFEHSETQAAYEAGTLVNWLQANAEELEHYNAFDVLALGELGETMRRTLAGISHSVCGQALDFRDYPTAPGFWMKVLKLVWKRDGIEPPSRMKTLEGDRWVRRSMTAGRVQNMAGKPDESPPIALEMLDITSSYPHVMAGCEFPIGEYVETPCEVEGKIGVYNVTILEQPALTILPKRVEGAPLDWSYTGQQDIVANSVDIASIRKHGGRIQVHDGIYWPKSSRELFSGFIGPLYAYKAAEDAKPKARRNNALREGVKLGMNSISGKVGQRPHYTVSELVQSTREFYGLTSSMEPASITFTMLSKIPLVQGVLTEAAADVVYQKKGSCAALASLIYANARDGLYTGLQFSGGVGGVGYCDTDSALMTWEAAEKMRQERPELFTEPGAVKALGSWDAELGQDGSKLFKAFRIAPKQYAVLQVNEDSTTYKTTKIDKHGKAYEAYGKNKIKVKGIGSKSVYLSPEQVELVGTMTHAQRAAYAAEHSGRNILAPETSAEVFHAWAKGEATAWLCLQGRRIIGGNGEAPGAGVRFDHIIKTLKPPAPL